jgi:hypothetical protein
MTEEKQLPEHENPNDELSTGLSILSFCIPIAGAIIYFSNKQSMPNKAKSACHAALWGIGIGTFINILGRIAGAS